MFDKTRQQLRTHRFHEIATNHPTPDSQELIEIAEWSVEPMGQNEERQKRWTFWLREIRGYSAEAVGCSRQVHELRACYEKFNIARVAGTFREFGPICAQMPEIWGRLNPPLTA